MIEVWDRPRFAPGATRLAFVTGVMSARMWLRVDQSHRLSLEVEPRADWLQYVLPGRVLYLAQEPEYREWRMESRKRTLGGLVAVEAEYLAGILRDAGSVSARNPAGAVVTNLGGLNLTARNYLTSFILPHLERRGIDYVRVGEVTPTRQFDLSWEGETPRELVARLAEETDCEWRLREDPDAGVYRIDIVPQINGEAEEVWVTEGRNILRFEEDRRRDRLYTVIQVLGAQPAGTSNRSTLAQNRWRVVDVSGDDVRVAPHLGGAGPLIEDGQFVDGDGYAAGYRLVNQAGEETGEVVASTFPDVFEVDGVGAIAVGDDVTLVGYDSDGLVPVTELRSPSGIAATTEIVGVLNSDTPGGANWMRDPGFAVWDEAPGSRDVYSAVYVSTGAGPVISLSGLPASLPIPAGTQVIRTGPDTSAQARGGHGSVSVTTAAATTSGTGTVTLSISDSLATGVGGVAVFLVFCDSRAPDYWSEVTPPGTGGGVQGQRRTGFYRIPRGNRSDPLTATLNGARDYSGTAASRTLLLSGLTEGDTIFPGDRIAAATGQPMMAFEEVVADSGGNAEVTVVDPAQQGPNWADSTALTITRPLPPFSGQGWAMWRGVQPTTRDYPVRSESLKVLLVPPGAPVTVTAHFSLGCWSQRGTTPWRWIGTATENTDFQWPRVRVRDLATDEIVATSPIPEPRTMLAGEFFRVEFTATAFAPGPDDPYFDPSGWLIRVEIEPPSGPVSPQPTGYSFPLQVLAVLSGVTVAYRSSTAFRIGSDATTLWQEGSRALAHTRYWTGAYRGAVNDLSEALGLDPASPSLYLGGAIRLRSTGLGVTESLRVVEMQYDPTQPEPRSVNIVLSEQAERITKQVQTGAPPPLYVATTVTVDVDVTVDTATGVGTGSGTTTETTIATPKPPTVPGVERAVVPPGELAPGGDGFLGLEIIP